MFYVYVLKSKNSNRLYIGYTANITIRLSEHRRKQTKSTRGLRDFYLYRLEIFEIKSQAIRREQELKGGQGRKWLKNNA